MARMDLVFVLLFLARVYASDKNEAETEKQSCKICGYGDKADNAKVVKGKPVNPMNKYPWVVSLEFTNDSFIFCTGALISFQYVLTAAHCLVDESQEGDCDKDVCPKSPADMRVGVWNGTEKEPPKLLQVQKVIPHPSFDGKFISESFAMFDIGLVQLEEGINCEDGLGPICLYKKNASEITEYLKVAGFGYSTHKGSHKVNEKRKLREGIMKQIHSEMCATSKKESNISDTIVCLKACKSKQLVCSGDSGSSIFKKIDGGFHSLGVLSSSDLQPHDPCSPKGQSKFTSVHSYMDWIEKHVEELPEPPEDSEEEDELTCDEEDE